MTKATFIIFPYGFKLMVILLIIGFMACRPTLITQAEIRYQQLTDGIYEGYFKHVNSASVQVVISHQKITEVKIVTFDASPIGQKAKDSIVARIVQQQTPYVDAVSGATSASNTIINATIDALQKAMK